MPTDCAENMTDFTQCMGAINAIIEDSGIDCVYVLGDFNAHQMRTFLRN